VPDKLPHKRRHQTQNLFTVAVLRAKILYFFLSAFDFYVLSTLGIAAGVAKKLFYFLTNMAM